MSLGNVSSRPRCAAVWASATVVAGVLMVGLLPLLAQALRVVARGDLSAAAFDTVLVWCCAAAAAATICWLWLVATLVTIEATRGVPAVRRGVPTGVRRAVLTLCGVALTSGLAAPALAGGVVTGGNDHGTGRLTGLRLPERASVSDSPPTTSVQGAGKVDAPGSDPAGTTVVAPAAQPTVQQAGVSAPRSRPRSVVVDPGDTLWALAAEQLGQGATAEKTAAAWPQIYALNRDLIGPDPGLIEPGQRLALPPVGSATGSGAGSEPAGEAR